MVLYDKTNPNLNAKADGPLNLSDEEQAEAIKTIENMRRSLDFFALLLQNSHIQKSDANTFLGLMYYGFHNLNRITCAGQFLDSRLNQAKAELREANKAIAQMRDEAGKQITATAGEGFLALMIDALTTWYIMSGFSYATEDLLPHGIRLKFASEVRAPETDSERIANPRNKEEIAVLTLPTTHHLFTEKSGYDVHWDGKRGSLLDTDNNRELLKALIPSTFSGARVNGFTSYQDRNIYLLKLDFFVPYTVIECWLKQIGFFNDRRNKK